MVKSFILPTRSNRYEFEYKIENEHTNKNERSRCKIEENNKLMLNQHPPCKICMIIGCQLWRCASENAIGTWITFVLIDIRRGNGDGRNKKNHKERFHNQTMRTQSCCLTGLEIWKRSRGAKSLNIKSKCKSIRWDCYHKFTKM